MLLSMGSQRVRHDRATEKRTTASMQLFGETNTLDNSFEARPRNLSV